jgi:hypothetical protein
MMVNTTFEFFRCQSYEDGSVYLVAEPSLVCYDDVWCDPHYIPCIRRRRPEDGWSMAEDATLSRRGVDPPRLWYLCTH